MMTQTKVAREHVLTVTDAELQLLELGMRNLHDVEMSSTLRTARDVALPQLTYLRDKAGLKEL